MFYNLLLVNKVIHYIIFLWIWIASFQTDFGYGQLIMDLPVFKIWVAPLALGECTMSNFENPQHKLYVLGDLVLSIFQLLCMFISWPKNTHNLTTIVDFNFQPISSFLKSWWWQKELISADRQNNKKNGLHNKNWQPFYGKEHDAWHTYVPADKTFFTCLSSSNKRNAHSRRASLVLGLT